MCLRKKMPDVVQRVTFCVCVCVSRVVCVCARVSKKRLSAKPTDVSTARLGPGVLLPYNPVKMAPRWQKLSDKLNTVRTAIPTASRCVQVQICKAWLLEIGRCTHLPYYTGPFCLAHGYSSSKRHTRVGVFCVFFVCTSAWVDVRETFSGPCAVAAAYAAVVDSARHAGVRWLVGCGC